jgi:hypothetical protein
MRARNEFASISRERRRSPAVLIALVVLGLVLDGAWLSGCLPIASRPQPASLTSTPGSTHSPEPTSTHTPTSTPELIQPLPVGRSVEGRAMQAVRIGRGSRLLVVASGTHGTESNTTYLAEQLSALFARSVSALPEGVAVYLLPEINPDGLAEGRRLNARDVDLNRNWETADWRGDTYGPDGMYLPEGGGTAPFSEPETAALAEWLLSLKDEASGGMVVLFYHSSYPGGAVRPGYTTEGGISVPDPQAAAVAEDLAERLGYEYLPEWPLYALSGESINWCAENGITCLLIELAVPGMPAEAEIGLHFRALWHLIRVP